MPKLLGACSMLAILSAVASPTFAAEADPNAATSGTALEEVVVTATKTAHAESIQHVAIAMSAVDAKAVANLQITDLMDLSRLVPNVQFGQVGTLPGYPNFTIRGIGINSSVRTVDPAVTVSIDGMPLTFPIGVILDTFDLGAIEILRGPQGVLEGRNSTGGAVTIQTRRPTKDFELEGNVRFGNSGRMDQSFLVSGPIYRDTVLAKVAVLHRASDGLNHFSRGTFTPSAYNPSGQPVGNGRDQAKQDDWIIRPIVTWEVTPTFDLTFIGEYINMQDGGLQSRATAPTARLSGAGGYGYTPPKFGNSINQNGDTFSKTESTRVGLQANWDVGPGIFTAITGYRIAKQTALGDNDGTPFTLQHTGTYDKGKQFSQEVRFASDFSDNFRFVVGGYYSTLDMTNLIQLYRGNTATNTQFVQQGLAYFDSKTYAAFGNFDFTAIDKLTLSAGARYTHDDKNLNGTIFNTCATTAFVGCPSAFTKTSKSWGNVSPRFAASYQVAEDVMVYGSWTKGFRSGAFNNRPAAVTGFVPADPEHAKSIEAGFKSTFWQRRARINVAVYSTDYTNIQRTLTVSGGAQAVLNAATAKIKGVEFEGTLRPIQGLQLDTSIGYTKARFNSFPLSSTFTTIPVDDLRFDRVPEWTATVGGSYEFALGSIPGDFTARTSYSYRSSQFSDVQNSPTLKLGSYGVWDASIAYEYNEHLRFLVYGRNLTNENYWDIATHNITPTYDVGDIFYGGQPRTYGIEISYKY